MRLTGLSYSVNRRLDWPNDSVDGIDMVALADRRGRNSDSISRDFSSSDAIISGG